MKFITKWVKNIIYLVLITTFLMMFLPNSDIKKYVRVIMGFFIISIFISPFTYLFNQDVDSIYEFIPEEKIQQEWDDLKTEGESIEESNNSYLNKNYQNQIKTKIKDYIDLEFPESKNDVEVEVNDEYEINKINVKIIDEEVQDIRIDPVDINSEEEQDETEKKHIDKKLIFETKNKLSNVFQIPSSKINIHIENRGEKDGNN
ncbi:MAG: stage III sporulation protein AF [bacterium]